MTNAVEIKKKLLERIWEGKLEAIEPPRRWFIQTARTVFVLVRDIAEGQLTLRAMSLVYTTLLSLVPVLAVSFSVLKGFGVHNQIEPFLLQVLAPLGEKGVEMTGLIIGFVDNIKVGVLGTLGLALLVYTVISLMQKIERSLNTIWHVASERSFARRFSDYLSVLLVGPVLVFSALGITGSVLNSEIVQWLAQYEPAGTILTTAGKLIPYLLIILAFAFVYKVVPNTRVSVRSAFVGALVAGILWQSAGLAFALFIASSTKYTAIYSSFAILIVTMIWLYLAWLIMLVGACIAYYHQHPEQLVREPDDVLAPRNLETLTLAAMILIARAYRDRRQRATASLLATQLGLPTIRTQTVLARLREAGLIVIVDRDAADYVPAVDPGGVRVTEILAAVRGTAGSPAGKPDPAMAQAGAIVDQLEETASAELGALTLADLADSPGLTTDSAQVVKA